MSEAAELGADDLERAGLDRGDRVGRGDTRNCVDLEPPLRHPEVMDDVLRTHLESDLLADRDIQNVRGDLLATLIHLERPSELLAGDLHDARILRRRLLDVEEQDGRVGAEPGNDQRRDGGPDDLEACAAVSRRTVEVLLARAHAPASDGEDHGAEHDHGDRHRDDQ